jgi:3-phosphoshikimate 1-carboxyvinyltransferase
MMQQFAGIKIKISNLSEAGDTILMQNLISRINDAKGKANSAETCELNCGNAGTVLRFLAAYLAGCGGNWILTGSERMKKRPVATLCNALSDLGASIKYIENAGFPPIALKGEKLTGGRLIVDASESSQFVSSLMMLAPVLQNGLCIELEGEIASRPYLEMTLGLLNDAGISARFVGNVIDNSAWFLPGILLYG